MGVLSVESLSSVAVVVVVAHELGHAEQDGEDDERGDHHA